MEFENMSKEEIIREFIKFYGKEQDELVIFMLAEIANYIAREAYERGLRANQRKESEAKVVVKSVVKHKN